MITKDTNLERLSLHVTNDDINILYRPIHTYIKFVKNDEEGKEYIKKLALMSRDEFKEVLKEVKCFPYITENKLIQATSSDNHDEKWYQGAWKMQTENIFKEIGVENPKEKTILSFEILQN